MDVTKVYLKSLRVSFEGSKGLTLRPQFTKIKKKSKDKIGIFVISEVILVYFVQRNIVLITKQAYVLALTSKIPQQLWDDGNTGKSTFEDLTFEDWSTASRLLHSRISKKSTLRILKKSRISRKVDFLRIFCLYGTGVKENPEFA